MTESELREHLFKSASAEKWRRIGTAKRSGVLVPLFSLHSKNSIGIGDFEDLKLLVDWCGKTGNTIIQLLPLNILGMNFCPYDSASSFALEPAYLSLRFIRDPSLRKRIEKIKASFPFKGAYVDYRVREEKLKLLREAFLKEDLSGCAGLKEFRQANAGWLEDFALFMAFKQYHQERPWYEWEGKYRERHADVLASFRQAHAQEIAFHVWMQWRLWEQLREAKEYAQSRGILIKGDLPILVSRDSADVWQHPEFFKLDFAAGAPPDMYCAKGQRWGMPPYNWEEIASEGYGYLKDKLRFCENFYDILRIDHVVGLFRIWSIPYQEPAENQGLHGFFDPRDERVWGEHGRKILTVMAGSTGMLLCAEDLGVIPPACTETLAQLGIPGNDVQRWVKDWKTKNDFLPPQEYRRLSVAMLSTHDTTNWAAWWEKEAGTVDENLLIRKCQERGIDFPNVKDALFDPRRSGHGRLRWRDDVNSQEILVWNLGKRKEEVMDFVEMYLNTFQEKEKLWRHFGLPGAMREKADSKIIAAAFKATLGSSAIFCIETAIDWLSLGNIFKGDPYQYRFNTPGTISPKNWSLRLPLSLEGLLKHKICKEITGLLTPSGRR
jgi:4-alpha-glucanotransferase